MLCFRPLLIAAATAFLAGMASLAPADAVVLLDDRRIEGTIVRDTENEVFLNTTYGELRFPKIDLKQIVRGSGSGGAAPGAPPSGGGSNGAFGAAPGSQETNPFAAGASGGNPFGASPAPASPAPSDASFNPFSQAPAPTAPAGENPGGVDLFGGFAVEDAPSASKPAAAPAQPLAVPDFVRPELQKPEIPQGYTALVYGVAQGLNAEVRAPGNQAWQTLSGPLPLDSGTEIRSNLNPFTRIIIRGTSDDLRLSKGTQLEIRELTVDGQKASLYLSSGSLFASVDGRSAPGGHFQVETPELLANLQGARFRVSRTGGATLMAIHEGAATASARNTGVGVPLAAGQGVVITAAGQVLDVIELDQAELRIWDQWDQWAEETVLGGGELAESFSPLATISRALADASVPPPADSPTDAAASNISLDFQRQLDRISRAFEALAQDTGVIPETEEGWSLLKFGDHLPGWQGPYLEGPVPPLDPWSRPLIYRKIQSPSGRILGRVYSLWQDGRDQGGTNASVDKIAHVMYYSLPRFEEDPAVNPR